MNTWLRHARIDMMRLWDEKTQRLSFCEIVCVWGTRRFVLWSHYLSQSADELFRISYFLYSFSSARSAKSRMRTWIAWVGGVGIISTTLAPWRSNVTSVFTNLLCCVERAWLRTRANSNYIKHIFAIFKVISIEPGCVENFPRKLIENFSFFVEQEWLGIELILANSNA